MTCLRAREVRLQVFRGLRDTQFPVIVIPLDWTDDQVLEYAKAAHEPLGHTVAIYSPGRRANLWLADPAGFTDYATGTRA